MSGSIGANIGLGAAALGLAAGGAFVGRVIHHGIEDEQLKVRDRQVALKESVESGELSPGQAAALPEEARALLDHKTPSVEGVRRTTTAFTSLYGVGGFAAGILGAGVFALTNNPKSAIATAALGVASLGAVAGGLIAQFEPRDKT